MIRRTDPKPLPPVEFLRAHVDYSPETGAFSRKPCGVKWRDTRFAGKDPFTKKGPDGHLRGSVGGQILSAHRVAFKLVYGRDPAGEIDHINGDPGDNRIVNLREADRSANMRNKALAKNNRSGHCGVVFHKSSSLWAAVIYDHGKRVYLGGFRDKVEAIRARKAAESRLGFSERHGEPQC